MPGDLSQWDEMVARVAALGEKHVRVGVIASRGGNAKAGDSGLTLCELAAIHEFGTSRTPERSFIRFTLEQDRDKIAALLAKLSAAYVLGAIDADRALKLIGEYVVTLIKANINERNIKQDLAPSTIARKGSDAALIDTGQLKNAITYMLSERAGSLVDSVREGVG